MKKLRLTLTPALWLSALCLMLTFQSCNKQEEIEPAAPTATVNPQDCGFSLPEACKTVPLIANNVQVGTVDVTNYYGHVLVTYNITAPRTYLTEIKLDAFTNTSQLQSANKLRNNCAQPDNYDFKIYLFPFLRLTRWTMVIPKSYVDRFGSDCFFIASNVELSNGASAWGGHCRRTNSVLSLDASKRFSGTSGSVYFEFCKDECSATKDFTYAWEDINNNFVTNAGNDGDYNDLVIQSHIIKSATEMKIQFLATAKGAGFDHKFKFKIPKAGITGIFDGNNADVAYTEDGTYYYITVFESTATVLPGSPGAPVGFAANTYSTQTACTPFASRDITLTINSSFVYNRTTPYEPFISVFYNFTGALAPNAPSYDLYIYEVSHRDSDIWTNDNQNFYPNGIVIPFDWRWPLEREFITGPYPSFAFNNVTKTLAPNWANNLANPSLTFNKSICN